MGHSTTRIRAERVDRGVRAPEPITDPDVVAGFLEDASGYGGGHARGVLRVRGEAEAAALVRATAGAGTTLLAQGARSSLTGGAVPLGDLVLALEGMDGVLEIRRDDSGAGTATAGSGIPLSVLQDRVRTEGLDYPPIPTHREASLGGTASTNAGGPGTFKHGVTRDWIRRVRGILPGGDVLDVTRGQAIAPAGGRFEIALADGSVLHVPVPDSYRTPPLRKVAAGYFVADETDLVDLLVGSEGTLLLFTEIGVRLCPRPAGEMSALMFLPDEAAALRATRSLRDASKLTWARGDPLGIDVRAIEFIGPNCLRIVRDRGVLGDLRLDVPADAGAALLFEAEFPTAVTTEGALGALEKHLAGETVGDGPLARLFRLLDAHVSLDALDLAFGDDEPRRRKFSRFRASVPETINEILAERRAVVPGLVKLGGDPIVPFDDLDEVLPYYHDVFERRGIDHAIWGHVSDGNLHPNAIPSTADQSRGAEEAQREIAAEATRRGGSPLSEHGVGRSRLKQSLLEDFYGPRAIHDMRSVKEGFDPEWRFAPGVLFPRKEPSR